MAQGKDYPVLSRREVEALIAEGRSILIHGDHVLKVDSWLQYHPGGDKAIMHMIGRDATDEITVLHSPDALKIMSRYRIGTISGRWKNFVPPIQGGVFRPLCEGAGVGDASAEDAGDGATTASSATSRSASPVFDLDAGEPGKHGLRERRRARSASPASSVDLPGVPDGMAHLDARTKEEIRLDLDKYPSLDPDTQDSIVHKYHLLHARLEAEGLFRCNYGAYAVEAARYALLFGLMLLFLRWRWYALSAFCLGSFWHQLVFTGHDAGHMGITHNFQADSVIAILVADYLGGLSMGWWKRNHNVHHIVTNSPDNDPDIQHLPFFAVSHRLLQSLRSTYYDRVMEYDLASKFLLSIQSYTYYPIMAFARFNLYRLSWEYLILNQGPKKGSAAWLRWLELGGQVFFWTWFGYGILYRSIDSNWDRFVFLLVSHMVTMPLHVQITLSHFAMSTADLGPDESFPQKMLRTTMDVDCPQWLDFFHGGLQFQAIHHLYPRMPRHNLRRAQKLVQEFCDDVDIPYALYGFVDGNKEVIGRLADISRQAAILAKCQKFVARREDVLHAH